MASPNPKIKPIGTQKDNDFDLKRLKDFLETHYVIRFNSVAEKPEIKNRFENDSDFEILEDYSLNSMFFKAKSEGLKVQIDLLKRLLESDFVEKINPIKEWFRQLKPTSGTNYIHQIIETVEFDNEESYTFFKKVFVKWFVALVANVFDETRCTNHTCLVFTGGQGKRKTTWFNRLIPNELELYKFNGKIDPNNKDTLALVHSKLLIIIDDQLKQINKRDAEDIKELITKDKVTYRRPFAVFDITRPHLASFAATVNGDDFLTDSTGSRRFLSFRVENCNTDALQNIDLKKAYSEAYQLYLSGFQYWFTDEEVKEIDDKNEEFTTISIEQELIEKLYDLSNPRGEFYASNEIKLYIENYTKDRITANKVGAAMTKLGIKKVSHYSDAKLVRKKYPITKKNIGEAN